ncbi:DUF983 domain-containing protein [Chitinophagaceae bacterium LB-8]|uniref:DUF983 domain-containing protein n=1 Tax=Paraflavisolibacter caeni TaxID=2982496 RepID=A0A9X2XZ76_9BACT|nr:DUF983 domain-containing protein [Paraflavisolibacter caeni]MCU7552289.1 DUF983 domain-containing protein [Paraflavisolibacter caeni]
MNNEEKKPGYVSSILKLKCPCCRKGNMFLTKSYSKHLMKMRDHCEVCGQPMEIEVGFYYGTSYVSYIITVLLSAISFVGWWILIGFSYQDNRFLYWVVTNAIALIAMQPYLMRFSRTLWLSFFVKYNQGNIFKP